MPASVCKRIVPGRALRLIDGGSEKRVAELSPDNFVHDREIPISSVDKQHVWAVEVGLALQEDTE